MRPGAHGNDRDEPVARPTLRRWLLTWLVLQPLLVLLQLVPLWLLVWSGFERLAESIAEALYTPSLVVPEVLFRLGGKSPVTLSVIAWFYAATLGAVLTPLWIWLRPPRERR